MVSDRIPEVSDTAPASESPYFPAFVQGGRATERQQGMVGQAAQRGPENSGQRQIIRLIVEEAEQLDQVGDLFPLVETLPMKSHEGNAGPA